LSNFKIGEPILQNDENTGTKTVTKPKFYIEYYFPLMCLVWIKFYIE